MYRFSFDGYINGNACGWILDLAKPNQPVALGIYIDGQLEKTGIANNFREDLTPAGLENGSCAFEIPIETDIFETIEVRVLVDGTVLQASRQNFASTDLFVNLIIGSRRFHSYNQFQPQNLNTKKVRIPPPRQSNRLSVSFNKTVRVFEGIKYSAHMAWLCSKLRRGAPFFFSNSSFDPLDDLYWYLFESKEPSKSFSEFDYDTVSDQVFPRFSKLAHHTVLFDLWLHRAGRQLLDIKVDGFRANFDFAVNLINSNSLPPIECGLDKLGRSSIVYAEESLVKELPAMTSYLLRKYEYGYKNIYHLEKIEDYVGFLFDCLLHAVSRPEIKLFGVEVLTFFQTPIILLDGVVSRFVLLCYSLSSRASGKQKVDLSSLSAQHVQKWFENVWIANNPLHFDFCADVIPNQPVKANIPTCYVVAQWNSKSGLTQNAQMSTKAIVDTGISVVKLMPNGAFFERIEPESIIIEKALVRDVVLLHINADDAPSALYEISGWSDLDKAFIVGYFLWELEKIPEAHHLAVELVDEIWVPTEFVANAYRLLAKEKVQTIRKGISVPEIKSINRAKFNLEGETKIFLTTFDFHSSVERKNPIAAIKAFQLAFTNRTDVRLVLKSTPVQQNHWGDPFNQWESVNQYISRDERLILIDEFLPDREMFELISASDVIVSPHRAEGFGYLTAYGMLYGKPVVATGYSGTNDHCSNTNSWLASFQLVKVPNERFIYPVNDAVWAEIDIESLAACMREALDFINTKNISTKRKKIMPLNRQEAMDLFSYDKLSKRYIGRFNAVKLLINN
jgi:glycosyltransferase involved in cell wall biosynthesis